MNDTIFFEVFSNLDFLFASDFTITVSHNLNSTSSYHIGEKIAFIDIIDFQGHNKPQLIYYERPQNLLKLSKYLIYM